MSISSLLESQKGLKLDGFGDCFDRHLDGAPWSDKFGDGRIAQYKFYLGMGLKLT